MGRLLPGNELRVVDPDTGRALGVGETGELAIKGPTLMKRYLGMRPEECFDADGFFHTGDAGSVDADGFVHWEGRRTEMIKTGGANVSPAELEVQLRACAPVKLARIVGVPDPRLDQLVVACITLKDGAEATEEDIQSFLRERVASYKVPKRVLFFDDGEIPMTTSDTKVRDDALVALVERAPRRRTLSPRPRETDDRATEPDHPRRLRPRPVHGRAHGAGRAQGARRHQRHPALGAGRCTTRTRCTTTSVWAAESRFGSIVAPQSFTVTVRHEPRLLAGAGRA